MPSSTGVARLLRRWKARWLAPESKHGQEFQALRLHLRARRYRAAVGAAGRFLARLVILPLFELLILRGPLAAFSVTPASVRPVLYSAAPDRFPNYSPRKGVAPKPTGDQKVTLVATLRNEAESLPAWIESLLRQIRPPDEVVIVDGGSTDGSLEQLIQMVERVPFPVRILSEQGANIARGRNLAIAQAAHEVIACTDLGSRLTPDWLAYLIAPFEDDPLLEVVAGWYEVGGRGRSARRLLGPSLETLNPAVFLPSSRSIAFKKSAWKSVGGYPEWMTLTGEDTVFALELRRACPRWAFAPDAIVEWAAPDGLRAYWRKIEHWSFGDGEAGTNARLYAWGLVRLISLAFLAAGVVILLAAAQTLNLPGGRPLGLLAGILLLYSGFWAAYLGLLWTPAQFWAETGAELARLRGYLRGSRGHTAAQARRFAGVPGFLLILAGVPIHDTGGGARGAQFAHEFLRRGYAVIYLHKYPSFESVDLNLVSYHPNLIAVRLADFRWASLKHSFGRPFSNRTLAALVEFPLREFLPTLNGLLKAGGRAVYDLLDDWTTALGGDWYSAAIEKRFIHACQALVATEASLAERLEGLSGRQVTLLPNAVNRRLFDPQREYPIPNDLPRAEWSAIYIGALWGDWFNWVLLASLARENPEAAVVVIGDYRGQCPDPPANLYFLGLKPQAVLPAYLAHTSVAIIPWHVNPITQATSPLKIYEYLAMHRPVVAPQLNPLRGIPGVRLAANEADFVQLVRSARSGRLPIDELEPFLRANDWENRAAELLRLVDRSP